MIVKQIAPPVPQPVNEPILYLIGKLSDSETGEPIMAKIDVLDLNTNLVLATTASSDVDGGYKVRLPEKKSYMVDLRATGFLSDMKRITIPENWRRRMYLILMQR